MFEHFFSCLSTAGWLQPNLCNCEKCCYNCNPLFFNIPRLDLDPIPCHFIHSLSFLTKSAWRREKVRRGQLRRNREKWQSMRAKPPAHAPYVSLYLILTLYHVILSVDFWRNQIHQRLHWTRQNWYAMRWRRRRCQLNLNPGALMDCILKPVFKLICTIQPITCRAADRCMNRYCYRHPILTLGCWGH